MSELRRLLADPEASTFERDLLESWSSEAPSPGARARALALAGLAVGAVTATATATATGSSVAGAAAAAPKVVAAAGLSGATKLGILGALVLGSAIMSAVIVRSSREAAPVPSAPAEREVPKAAATATAAAETRSVSLSELPEAPNAEVRSPAVPAPSARAQASAAPRTETPSSLAEEIASFDGARAALEAGEVDRTLSLVDTYERRFPTGTFVQEAEVLRVKALAATGDRAGARRASERFLAAHPTSPHAPRIRAILDSSPP